jgi:uncharacterized MAPEG superfamily protein
MNIPVAMTADMGFLVHAALLSIVMWVPYILAGIMHFGLIRMVSYPACDFTELPMWAQRLYRAHMNLVENLAPFAALVIVAQITGAANEATALGASLFFWARLVQIAGHTAGIPFVRTLAFAVGVAGNVIILLQIIG